MKRKNSFAVSILTIHDDQ